MGVARRCVVVVGCAVVMVVYDCASQVGGNETLHVELHQVSLKDMKEHTQQTCSHRIIKCPLRCGITVGLHLVERHKKTCDHRQVECRQGCGLTMRWVDRKVHEAAECKHRLAPCGLVRVLWSAQHLRMNTCGGTHAGASLFGVPS